MVRKICLGIFVVVSIFFCKQVCFGQTVNQRLSNIEKQFPQIFGEFSKLHIEHGELNLKLDNAIRLLQEIQNQLNEPPVDPPPPTDPPTDPPQPPSSIEQFYNIVPIDVCELSPTIILKGGTFKAEKNLKFEGDAFVVAGPNVTIDLNGKTVYFNTSKNTDSWGVLSYRNREPFNLKYNIPDAQNAQNLKIINGNLIGLNGDRVVCLNGYTADNVAVENVYFETKSGDDSSCINFEWGQISVKNSTLVCGQTGAANRHLLPGNIRVVNGGVYAENNIIVGGNSGIVSAHRTPNYGGESFILNNFIAPNAVVTNGYGFFQGIAKNNIVLPPDSGRGFYLGSNLSAAEYNVALAWENPNSEFGWGLNSPGIRSRYGTNNTIARHNFCLAVGGNNKVSCSGLYLSNYDTSNIYENNTFITINMGDTNGQTAKALTLETQGGESGQYVNRDIIRNNNFFSNQYLISISGPDGPGYQLEPIVGNILGNVTGQFAYDEFNAALSAKITELKIGSNPLVSNIVKTTLAKLADLKTVGILGNSKTFYTGYWGDKEQITILNSTRNGQKLTPTVNDFHYSPRNSTRLVMVGEQRTTKLVSNGAPYGNKTVTVITENEVGKFNLTTSLDGTLTFPHIFQIFSNSGADKGIFIETPNTKMYVKTASGATPVLINGNPVIIQ